MDTMTVLVDPKTWRPEDPATVKAIGVDEHLTASAASAALQARVPKGNGRLSGRWVDMPGHILDQILSWFPDGPDQPAAVQAAADIIHRHNDKHVFDNSIQFHEAAGILRTAGDPRLNKAADDLDDFASVDWQSDPFNPIEMANTPDAPEPPAAVPDVGTPDNPIDVGDNLEQAAQLLSQGKHVRVNRVDEIGTLEADLAKMVKQAEMQGQAAPTFNLCEVTVPGTNLFCTDSKNVPRAQMPQLAGIALPGTPAAKLANAQGEVDLFDAFKKELADKGIKTELKTVPATSLKATQNELDGPKVAAISAAMRAGKVPEEPIWVTRDGYIIDGHHRWAAKVSVDADDGKLGNIQMPVEVVDMDIGQALSEANAFADKMGIEHQGIGAANVEGNRGLEMGAPTPEASSPKDLPENWRLSHRAPGRGEGMAASDKPDEWFPDLFEHPEYYPSGVPDADRETLAVLRKVQGNPDAKVTIYRAVPTANAGESIQSGDWVTLSPSYAKQHGESNLVPSDVPIGQNTGDKYYKVVSKEVRAGDIFNDANSLAEWGYDPQEPDLSSKLISALAGDALAGGFTFDTKTMTRPKSGYVVALRGGSSIKPARNKREAADQIKEFLKNPNPPSPIFGGWFDKEHNEIVLDYVEILDDRDEAIRRGQDQNQQAIFHLDSGEEIDTGGTGDRTDQPGGVQPTTGQLGRHDPGGAGRLRS